MGNYIFETVDIKGKSYVTVSERVKYFRLRYPDYTIRTDIKRLTSDEAVVKAEILDVSGRVLSDGLAYELRDSTFINKTSFLENCQTSAIGRALAFMAIGIDDSIASTEELVIALKAQKEQGVKNGKERERATKEPERKPVRPRG